MSTNVSQFHHRTIYNHALYHRYGKPTSLDDYLLKAQMMDYEATRAEFEGFAAKWNAQRPATGAIYWMLNNAWPSLHWNLFDYYLHPAGSSAGTKVGCRSEHVAYDYQQKSVYLINRSLSGNGRRTIAIELIDLEGNMIANHTISAQTVPNHSKVVGQVPGVDKIKDVAFLRMISSDSQGNVLSRNVYWITSSVDTLEWKKSTWYYTPVKSYVDYRALQQLERATVTTSTQRSGSTITVNLENHSDVPAFFIRMNLVDREGNDIVPVYWSDNYVTLFPHEKMDLEVSYEGVLQCARIEMSGSNIAPAAISYP